MPENSTTLVTKWVLQSAARRLLPAEKGLQCCYRHLVVPSAGVPIKHKPKQLRAYYANLRRCGLVWLCPICSERISEGRRVELAGAIDLARGQMFPALITLTMRHQDQDELGVLLAGLLEAYRFLKAGKRWQNFVRYSGWAGSVRGLEPTYGENGWHPHLHILAFFKTPNLAGVEDFFRERWIASLQKYSQDALPDYGVDVRTQESDVADYITKFGREPLNEFRPFRWSMEHEVTKGVLKRSRSEKGFTPIQLLWAFAEGDKRTGDLWAEYARVFKGKNQLVWSRGLRDLLGLGKQKPDGVLASEKEETSLADVLLARLELYQWNVILKKEKRGEVLRAAAAGDVVELNKYLESIGAGKRFVVSDCVQGDKLSGLGDG